MHTDMQHEHKHAAWTKPWTIAMGMQLGHGYAEWTWTVPDRRSRDLEVVVVRRIINLGTGNLEWGRNGKGLKMGSLVHE